MQPGQDPYPANPLWKKNVNWILYPQLIPEDLLWQLVGVTHQELFRMSHEYAVPFFEEGGPAGGRR